MRIDSHAHGQPSRWTRDPRAYIEQCREHGIEGVLLIAELDQCLEGVRRFGEFVIPVLLVRMDRCGALLESSLAKLCFGTDATYFNEGPHRFPPYIEFYERLFEAAQVPPALREQINRGNIRRLFLGTE